MEFKKARFLRSATRLEECPPPDFAEICFAGRSNVGKSSLINGLMNHGKLARTSNVPGKTQQMNYYLVDEAAYFVDLPGFGYAKVPKTERERWGKEIRRYLLNRETLALILHLVDARHKPAKLDEEFFYWMGVHQKPFFVVLTKSDKLSHNKQQQSKARVRRVLEEMNIEVPIVLTSAKKKTGLDDLKEIISEFTEQ